MNDAPMRIPPRPDQIRAILSDWALTVWHGPQYVGGRSKEERINLFRMLAEPSELSVAPSDLLRVLIYALLQRDMSHDPSVRAEGRAVVEYLDQFLPRRSGS